MTKTFLEIKQADQLVGELYKVNPALEKGKFGWAWKKFAKKNYIPIIEELNEKLENNSIKYCLTDEKTKEILRDEKGGYKFTKEEWPKLLEVNRKLLKEYGEKEIEIEPCFVKPDDVPELSEYDKEILTGLIIQNDQIH